MFRIHFVVDGAYWAIQFLRWEAFWVSVKGGVRGPSDIQGDVSKKVLKFDTYKEAYKYAEDRGITEVYPQKESSPPPMFDRESHLTPPRNRVFTPGPIRNDSTGTVLQHRDFSGGGDVQYAR